MNPSRMAALGPIHSGRAGFSEGLVWNYFPLQYNPLDPQRSAHQATSERPPFSLSSILSEFLGAQNKFPHLCINQMQTNTLLCWPPEGCVVLQSAGLGHLSQGQYPVCLGAGFSSRGKNSVLFHLVAKFMHVF